MVKFPLPEKIETARLILQRLKYEDAEEIFYTYASKEEATKYLAWPTHKDIDDTRQYLLGAVFRWNEGLDYSYTIRLKNTNRLVGSFGIVNDNGSVQFGYVLSPTQWGRGYATEACQCMMKVLKSIPVIKKITTFVDAENIASIKVLEKTGLVSEGIFKEWFKFINQNMQAKDCVLMRLSLQEQG